VIISASRRTDIPAFYSEWLLNRLKEGYVLVRNPINRLVSRIALEHELIDCMVFWTKNPLNMLQALDTVDAFGIPYYFLFTVNPYGREIEVHLPPVTEIIDTFLKLANRVGKERVIWRYDPILLSRSIDPAYHYERFEEIAERLRGYTGKCIISFLTLYKKCRRNLSGLGIIEPDDTTKKSIAQSLQTIAQHNNIDLAICSDETLADIIPPGKCIDDALISRITGRPFIGKKDKSQRPACRCVESIDIGAYNTCLHGCRYCYANFDRKSVERNYARYDPESPLLCDTVRGDERIVERKVK